MDMIKKTYSILLIFIIMVFLLSGCSKEGNRLSESATEETSKFESFSNELSWEELQKLTNPDFSASPYSKVEEGAEVLSNDEIKAIIANVPSDKYELYPSLHNVPVSATLYKGDEVISIDVKDARLIQLVNFYNNSVYYSKYSYTQGLLDIDYIEKVENENFRLELKYTPYKNSSTVPYDTTVTLCDTVIVTNKWFVLIAHERPAYEGEESMYNFHAVGHMPLYYDYFWLELFGF